MKRWAKVEGDVLPVGLELSMVIEEEFVEIDALYPYAVSNYGTVVNVITNQEMAQHTDAQGRKKVTIRRGKKKYSLFVHRWVAMAFLPDYQADVEVLHRNEIIDDNAAVNLVMGGPCRGGDDFRS